MDYIRDLGGLKTVDNRTLKSGMLFRGSQTYKATSKQIKFLKSIKLNRIIDLRNKQETIDEPNIELNGVDYINLSLIDTNLNGITHEDRSKQLIMLRQMPTMLETYIDLVNNDYSINKIKEVIREVVLNNKFPTLIHCVTGKDRAGVIIYCLLKILDISEEDIINDYLKQKKYYINTARFLYTLAFIMTFDKNLSLKAYDWFTVRTEFITSFSNALDKRFGSFDLFISDFVKLSNEDIVNFKNNLLM